jgi:hypothetical protein
MLVLSISQVVLGGCQILERKEVINSLSLITNVFSAVRCSSLDMEKATGRETMKFDVTDTQLV